MLVYPPMAFRKFRIRFCLQDCTAGKDSPAYLWITNFSPESPRYIYIYFLQNVNGSSISTFPQHYKTKTAQHNATELQKRSRVRLDLALAARRSWGQGSQVCPSVHEGRWPQFLLLLLRKKHLTQRFRGAFTLFKSLLSVSLIYSRLGASEFRIQPPACLSVYIFLTSRKGKDYHN